MLNTSSSSSGPCQPRTLYVGCSVSSSRVVPLSVLDATMFPVFSRVICAYGNFYDLAGTDFESFLAAVTRGLEAALERTPALTGCIVTLDDGTLELHPVPGRGIPVNVDYRSSPTLAELEAANYALVNIPDNVALPTPFSAALKITELLVLHATSIPGGAIVGFNSHHLVFDGASMFHFMNGGAAFARGDTTFALRAKSLVVDSSGDSAVPFVVPPFTTPTVAGGACIITHPDRGMRTFDRISAALSDPVATAAMAAGTPSMRAGRLLFPRSRLDALKATLLAALSPAQREEVGFLSSNDAIVGALWSAITRARIAGGFVQPHAKTQFSIPVNVRQRLVPPVEQDAFGNGTMACYAPLRASAVAVRGWAGAALGAYHMRRALAVDLSAAKITSMLAFYEALPRKDCVETLSDWPFGTDSVMASWVDFDIYAGADFGVGGPPRCVLPGPPSSLVDGAMYALPANAVSSEAAATATAVHGSATLARGGIEVTLCFRVEVYEALLCDEELMQFATALD